MSNNGGKKSSTYSYERTITPRQETYKRTTDAWFGILFRPTVKVTFS